MVDMKRAMSEKVAEQDAKLTALEMKMERYKTRIARVQAQLNQAQRRARAHRLITLGAELERLVGRELDVDEVAGLLKSTACPHDPAEHADGGEG